MRYMNTSRVAGYVQQPTVLQAFHKQHLLSQHVFNYRSCRQTHLWPRDALDPAISGVGESKFSTSTRISLTFPRLTATGRIAD